MEFILLLGVSFILGSIPFGLLITKYGWGIDLRNEGSGNIGMTNVMRVTGKAPGILTFLLDFSKGSVAILLARHWLSEATTPAVFMAQLSAIGAAVISGHVYSIFLRFKGGKGISTLFGVLAILNFSIGLVAALIWLGIFFAKRISSLSAITMLISLPLLFIIVPYLTGEEFYWGQWLIFTAMSGLLTFRHRDNIKRLIDGDERQLHAKHT